ncbi:MAG: MCE family protein [Saprospiraceae bacterium]|nr:MCE family protein [Saprospiraceae bacterium]
MDTHKEKFKIRLGLFVVLGLLLFVLAVFIIGKQKNLFDPVFRVTATFYNVSGLQVGNTVRFSGINVGTVDNIAIINDSTVRVDMLIRQNVQKFIKSDSEVGIGSEGIIGDRILVLSQGSTDAPIIEDGEEITSTEPVETDAIIQSLEITAANAELISIELADMLENINSGKGTLGKLIHDDGIASNLSKTMDNLESSSKGLDENMEAAKSNILLRGFFKKKEREERKKLEAAEKAKEKQDKAKKEAAEDAAKEKEKQDEAKKKAAEKAAKEKEKDSKN